MTWPITDPAALISLGSLGTFLGGLGAIMLTRWLLRRTESNEVEL